MGDTAAPPAAAPAPGLPAAPGNNPLSRKLNKILETRLDNDKVGRAAAEAGGGGGPGRGSVPGPAWRGAACLAGPDEPSGAASPDRLRGRAASPGAASVPLRSRKLTFAAFIRSKIGVCLCGDMPRTCAIPSHRREVCIAQLGGRFSNFSRFKCFIAVDVSCFNQM